MPARKSLTLNVRLNAALAANFERWRESTGLDKSAAARVLLEQALLAQEGKALDPFAAGIHEGMREGVGALFKRINQVFAEVENDLQITHSQGR